MTGANYLLEADGKKILVDCGLEQGTKLADDANWAPFPYDPKSIDILFVTHAHVDHLGRIPKLVADGFRGKIYSTEPTRALAGPMLDDTMGPALAATLEPGQSAPTADLQVQFLRPARPGPLTGRGRIVRRTRDLAFLAGELLDEAGEVVATATATAVIRTRR